MVKKYAGLEMLVEALQFTSDNKQECVEFLGKDFEEISNTCAIGIRRFTKQVKVGEWIVKNCMDEWSIYAEKDFPTWHKRYIEYDKLMGLLSTLSERSKMLKQGLTQEHSLMYYTIEKIFTTLKEEVEKL